MNPLLQRLHPYPFERLRELSRGIVPPAGLKPISLGIGEPRHATPAFIEQTITASLAGLSIYPATAGETALREAAVIICGQIAIAAEAIPGIPAASLASTKISLAYRLSEAGQDARAAEELQGAVRILEDLYEREPAVARARLAQAQNNYAGVLNELSRRTEALAASRRATTLYEAAELNAPGTYQAEWAASLNSLATMLATSGDSRGGTGSGKTGVGGARNDGGQRPPIRPGTGCFAE